MLPAIIIITLLARMWHKALLSTSTDNVSGGIRDMMGDDHTNRQHGSKWTGGMWLTPLWLKTLDAWNTQVSVSGTESVLDPLINSQTACRVLFGPIIGTNQWISINVGLFFKLFLTFFGFSMGRLLGSPTLIFYISAKLHSCTCIYETYLQHFSAALKSWTTGHAELKAFMNRNQEAKSSAV